MPKPLQPGSCLPLAPLLLLLAVRAEISAEVPTTFGLMTVTHSRVGDNSQFMKYLEKYATMDCSIMTEINIVWNNEESMEELGIYANQKQWKRPVHFYRTPTNSMNWRYKVPLESKSDVFFSIDDDITVDCDELKKGFQVWRENAIGNIGPIISYGPRYYEYTLKGGLQYGKGKTKNVFNMGLVGLAFISRHFMDLYYSDAFEVKEMRDYVVTKNNCDDIGLNWVVQYFYPELLTKAIDGNVLNISPKFAQATSTNHYPFRTKCIQQFTQIFGVNALRYSPMLDGYPGKEKRIQPLRREIVLAKKAYLEKYVIGTQTPPSTNPEASALLNTAANAQPSTPTPVQAAAPTTAQTVTATPPPSAPDAKATTPPPPAPAAKAMSPSEPSAKKALEVSQKQLQKLEDEVKGLRQQLEQAELNAKQIHTETGQTVSLQQRGNDSLSLSEQLRLSLYWRSYLQLGLVLVILGLIWKLVECSKDKQGKSKLVKLQSSETVEE